MSLRGLPLALLCLVAGCAVMPDRSLPTLADAAVELSGTPFFPQTRDHCGPAALATVLQASGVAVEPDALAPELFLPERQGTLQLDLVGSARRRDRLPVIIGGDLAELVRQLQAGRPVLVLQNLGYRRLPRWHYAVVIGYQPREDRFVLRSGTTERLTVSRRRFETSWARADGWGLVLLAPDEEPVELSQTAYLRAAAGMESIGRHSIALQAFDSAVQHWPDAPLALLGRANNLYQLGRFGEAEAAYRRLLALAPGHRVGTNNLVTLLLEQHRPCEASAVLSDAQAADPTWDSDLAAEPEIQACRASSSADLEGSSLATGSDESRHD